MIVLQRFVAMLVIVAFGQMQPCSEAHQNRCQTNSKTQRFAEERDGNDCTDKRSGGEIRARAGRADVPERQHEQSQA